jgi:hypothetical protein
MNNTTPCIRQNTCPTDSKYVDSTTLTTYSIVIIQWLNINKLTLANTEGAIENEKCRETGNIGYEEKQNKKYNTICVGHY